MWVVVHVSRRTRVTCHGAHVSRVTLVACHGAHVVRTTFGKCFSVAVGLGWIQGQALSHWATSPTPPINIVMTQDYSLWTKSKDLCGTRESRRRLKSTWSDEKKKKAAVRWQRLSKDKCRRQSPCVRTVQSDDENKLQELGRWPSG